MAALRGGAGLPVPTVVPAAAVTRSSTDPLAGFAAWVDARIAAAIAAAQRPEFTHQRNVEAVVGLPARTFLRAARAGAFPVTREHRLVLARTSDVVAYCERIIALRDIALAANDANAETVALARVGARRVSP